jgi:hypothetical protein
MSYTKRIVCLANSRKPPSGRCIAGREIGISGFGAWVRPVSARSTQEVSEEERQYEDGTDPRLLDLISIKMEKPCPSRHQTENHVIDAGYYWTKHETVSWDQIQAAVETVPGPLWINGYSTYNGLNDQVPESRLDEVTRSLYLIRPEKLVISVGWEGGGEYGPARRRVRAHFNLSGNAYVISVTDPIVERRVRAGADGETSVPKALVCVSLGEPFHGNAYKLAAAIVTPSTES